MDVGSDYDKGFDWGLRSFLFYSPGPINDSILHEASLLTGSNIKEKVLGLQSSVIR
jgi:hypothetical protein